MHDDELTNGAYGLGKGIVELMGQQKLLQAQRWVRGIFPETWPVFRPARKHLEIPPPDMSSQGSPSPETSMATPSAARHPGTARNSNPVLGVLCCPPGLRRMVAAARQGGGATMSLRDTNVSIAEVFWAWLQADPQMREWGLLGFAHLWFLQRESGVVAAEDRLVMLMSCAAAQGMGMSASPRCRAFARLTGVLDGGLPPKGCTEACLEAWGALVSPNGGGGPSHENEAGLIYVNQVQSFGSEPQPPPRSPSTELDTIESPFRSLFVCVAPVPPLPSPGTWGSSARHRRTAQRGGGAGMVQGSP